VADEAIGFAIPTTLRQSVPTADERRNDGRALRKVARRDAHGDWSPPRHRDPLKQIDKTIAGLLKHLVRLRIKKMKKTAFAYFRGTADVMARDLAATPTTGLHYPICGDAHAGNFGIYALPDDETVVDLNDFDEARPGPWEWDVKRLATSVVLVARGNNFAPSVQRAAAFAAAQGYGRAIADAADLGIFERFGGTARETWPYGMAPIKKTVAGRPWEVVEWHAGRPRLQPDKIDPIAEDETEAVLKGLGAYLPSLAAGRDRMLADYRAVAVAGAKIGLGSLGVRDYLVLLQGQVTEDILVLQIKEAVGSRLTPTLGPFDPGDLGRWVVVAQRSMQAFNDPLIGWTAVAGRPFSVRKRRASGEALDPTKLNQHHLIRYAGACGAALGYAHGRCGDPIKVDAYLGKSPRFALAIAHFAIAYANQVEDDYERFRAEVAAGEFSSDNNH
jgi:uncharacterized protein (DUF2252 family)